MKDKLQKDVLRLLTENARMPIKEFAERLDKTEKEIKDTIKNLEDNNIIRGYKAIFDESAFDRNIVKAIIEVRVRPERDGGFNKIAERISKFPEVNSLYLVSGGFDLQLEVQGENLQDVAGFVSSKLATIEGVLSTATHFLLKKYKESGKILYDGDEYERLKITP